MSYQNGTATSIADLFTKLNTFAAANGWTVDYSASDRLFLTRSGASDSVSVAFRWASSSPTCAGIYQHTAFINSSTDPGSHTNDSGQGAISGTNATLLTGRNVPLTNGSMQYWFFESDYYIYVVAETASNQVVHFGFGELVQRGSWTGGAFSYGYVAPSGTSASAILTSTTQLLDGL